MNGLNFLNLKNIRFKKKLNNYTWKKYFSYEIYTLVLINIKDNEKWERKLLY